MKPKLPDAGSLLPYLRRIDETRIYSNQGPLSLEFERRAASELNMPTGAFIAAASGTAALVAAILATAGRPSEQRPLALIPAFTFVATASAVEQCGYIPYLLDVDEATWALDPTSLVGTRVLARAGVVVTVAPFGRPQPQRSWRAFRDQASIPVVVDGAATFDLAGDSDFLGDIPVTMSFNATKAFATGEGGAVVTTDNELAVRVRRALNFGFFMNRESRCSAMNGKMSEYHAAVGLAELDGWRDKRSALHRLAERYRHCAREFAIEREIVSFPTISLSYVLHQAENPSVSRHVENALHEQSIGTRRWYGAGLQNEPYLAEAQRDELAVTNDIAARLLGIPVAPDLGDASVKKIVAHISAAEGEASSLN